MVGQGCFRYDMIRVFGCPAYYHVSHEKLELQARKAMLLGFKRGVKGYKLLDSEDIKIVLSKDVTFDESSMMKSPSSQQVESGQIKGISSRWIMMHLHHLQIVLYRLGCHLL